MSEGQLFRIKPLEWNHRDAGTDDEDWESTIGIDDSYVVWHSVIGWQWARLCDPGAEIGLCDSLEHGKVLVFDHWCGPDGIGRFLEPVDETALVAAHAITKAVDAVIAEEMENTDWRRAGSEEDAE